ncbi:hypothetical protein M9H77_02997 [Catharanthus roseus]|uniref:Uncharacterized protein n=1 Tax=Catharanthus roseus TaxID=4058 RepID=A0ACC0C9Y1_CATRO|nr:hypothetical protein M9H77_02997 [Catharanthus roseus]
MVLGSSYLLPMVGLNLLFPIGLGRKTLQPPFWARIYYASLIMSMDGDMPTQSHQEGLSDPSRMNLNETLRSMQQSIEGLARQFQSVARDVEELKKSKSSATIEQRVGDKLGGRPQHRSGRRGGLGGRLFHRPQEEYPRKEAWQDDNFYEDYGDNPNVSQAYHGGYYHNQLGDKTLDKIKWKVHSFKSESDPNEDAPKVAFKDYSKPKVEEKEKLITNPTRCFKCNGLESIAINCPTKRTFLFSEDLNGWIEKSDD